MPSARTDRAGGAFVELYTKNGPLYAGLAAAQEARGLRIRRYEAGPNCAPLHGHGPPLALAIKAGSDMEETMNKFNVVFGTNAEKVKAWGDEYAAQVGRSKQQIADFLAGSQDLFVPMGFDAASARANQQDLNHAGRGPGQLQQHGRRRRPAGPPRRHDRLGRGDEKYGVILSQTAVDQELLNKGMDAKAATEQQEGPGPAWPSSSAGRPPPRATRPILRQLREPNEGPQGRPLGHRRDDRRALPASHHAACRQSGLDRRRLREMGRGQQAAAGDDRQARGDRRRVGLVLVAVGGAGTVLSGILGGLAAIVPVVGAVLGALATAFGFLVSPIGLRRRPGRPGRLVGLHVRRRRPGRGLDHGQARR